MPKKYRPFLLPVAILFTLIANAQPGAGYKENYQLSHSGHPVADKNFYWLTVIDQSQPLKNLLIGDPRLRAVRDRLIDMIKSHVSDTCSWAGSMITGFRFTPDDEKEVGDALLSLYQKNKTTFDDLINHELRPSGCYQHYVALPDDSLLLHAWTQTAEGINYIIDQYGLGKKMRYPRIDSLSYDINSRYYRGALKDIFAYLAENDSAMTVFYQPALAVAMQLLDLNDRDEAARFEPLESGENKQAVEAIHKTNWSKYPYATIVVPGEGPELTTVALDPMGRVRCDLAAARFRKGVAPFIIVSGGFVHPFHTPYAEAFEMKKYLLTQGIPASAIIIDPQARHTTTNLRNADRLMIRYGIPITKPSDIVSTKSQIDYIALPQQHFDERNLHELGYLPYRDKNRTGVHDVSFYPVLESLQIDPLDPLDP